MFRAIGLVLGVIFVVPLTLPSAAEQPGNAPPRGDQKVVLVIHGGSGVATVEEMKLQNRTREEYEAGLTAAIVHGYNSLRLPNKSSLDSVEAAIRVLEDSELFNAGKGAVFTSDGRVELDAAIMDGCVIGAGEGKLDPRKRAGAVTGLTHVKNPISAARAVLEMPGQRHAFFAGTGAEDYVLSEAVRTKYDIEKVSNLYFWTDHRIGDIRRRGSERKVGAGPISASHCFGTVGAVAVDAKGRIAAGTSTGGLTGKLPGRIGDTPVIGAGTYADDRACGVSCTGTGELFIRHAVAHDVVARMLYAKATVADAANQSLQQLPSESGGVGGLIALDGSGRHRFAMSAKLEGMYRGYVTEAGEVFVGIFASEKEKAMGRIDAAGKLIPQRSGVRVSSEQR